MLVLSRQRDETIIIGDNIEITIVDIRGEKVRLGITAPSHIAVHRKEVYESMRRESQAAGNPVGHAVSLAKKKSEAGQPPSAAPPTASAAPPSAQSAQ